MDDVTKAALEIAVEQLEEAERIIEALTNENERLKRDAINPWQTIGSSGYPRGQVTWTSAGTSNATITHVGLHTANMTNSSNHASVAVVDLTAKTQDFKIALDSLRTRYEAMITDPKNPKDKMHFEGGA